MIPGLASPLATAVEPGHGWAAGDDEVAAVLHPRYRDPLRRVPRGRIVARGLPFLRAPEGADRAWLLIDRDVEVDLGGVAATRLVLLHFCDAWRDAAGERPIGVPIGWVVPVGEPLARVVITDEAGRRTETVLRRRFEVNEGIIGWGSGAFLALPHRVEGPVAWQGPHPAQAPGRYAPAGHAGPMTILPGSWGGAQSGVEDHVPSATDELMLWLHAVDVTRGGPPVGLSSVTFTPIAGPGSGRSVVVAAVTAFRGGGSPLRWEPRRSLRLTGGEASAVGVDLGIVARRRPLPPGPGAEDPDVAHPPVAGWGVGPLPAPTAEQVELTAAADAVLRIGREELRLDGIAPGGRTTAAGVRVEALPRADRRIEVAVVDTDGAPIAARVACRARDGRPLAPLGHRDEVNPGLYEDVGADLLLGGVAWAYVDGTFTLDTPPDGAALEVVAGPARAPASLEISPDDLDRGALRVTMRDQLVPGRGRWVSGDTHVHFLAPSTALLQARAEGVNAVHLLATQFGDLHTSLTDFGADLRDPGGRHAVWVGSENRQNLLGHIGLVGSGAPLLPFAVGGPPEGPIGGALTGSMADWLLRCREAGGLAVGAHFPLPMAEVAADIAAGLLDALELQCFDPTLESPPIREWYRYLDAGYRLPIVGGTDRMSAEVPLGQVRTWVRLEDDEELTFAAWAAAIRAGRTFVSSGPVLELRVEGREPGDVVHVSPDTAAEVELVARATQPLIDALELVADGRVVAARTSRHPVAELVLQERVSVGRTGWMAGRSRSPFAIGSGFASAMAAHTSPVYVEVPGRPRAPVDLGLPLTLIDGTRAWLEMLAPIADPRDLERLRTFLGESERRLRERSGGDR